MQGPFGIYNATSPSLTDKEQAQLQLNSDGSLKTSASGAAPVGGGITYTDRTITSASGASQTLAAANTSRKSLMIKNGGSATGVSLTGATAAIGGAATLTLQPFEPLFLSGADCPTGAITVISTATAYISAYEGT